MFRSSTVALIVCAGIALAQDTKPEPPQAAKEHEFLKRFVGEWDCETEAFIEPGKPIKSKGTMTGHMIGDFWAVVVVRGEAFGQPFHGQGLFGFDSRKERYVGTWTDSMSDFLWHYDGTVDGSKLVLDSEGPNPGEPGKLLKFRDTWEFKGKDEILLTGEVQGPEGTMLTMVKFTCTRKK